MYTLLPSLSIPHFICGVTPTQLQIKEEKIAKYSKIKNETIFLFPIDFHFIHCNQAFVMIFSSQTAARDVCLRGWRVGKKAPTFAYTGLSILIS